MDIEGKVAVDSGGASGIGRAAVLALVERGAKVVVADLDAKGGRQTVELAAARGGRGAFHRRGVAKTEDLESIFAFAGDQPPRG